MDAKAAAAILFHGNQLKRTPRTGWIQRGIPNAESVAAHTFGVVFTTLLLAELVPSQVDVGKALAMAALHDLPEALTSDIPSPAWSLFPPGIKPDVERKAVGTMLVGLTEASRLSQLYEEFATVDSAETRLVHDADRLDLFLQALVYEEQTGNQQMAEFWQKPVEFHFSESRAIYDYLRAMRSRQTG